MLKICEDRLLLQLPAGGWNPSFAVRAHSQLPTVRTRLLKTKGQFQLSWRKVSLLDYLNVKGRSIPLSPCTVFASWVLPHWDHHGDTSTRVTVSQILNEDLISSSHVFDTCPNLWDSVTDSEDGYTVLRTFPIGCVSSWASVEWGIQPTICWVIISAEGTNLLYQPTMVRLNRRLYYDLQILSILFPLIF